MQLLNWTFRNDQSATTANQHRHLHPIVVTFRCCTPPFPPRWVRDALGLDRPDAAAVLRRCPQVTTPHVSFRRVASFFCFFSNLFFYNGYDYDYCSYFQGTSQHLTGKPCRTKQESDASTCSLFRPVFWQRSPVQKPIDSSRRAVGIYAGSLPVCTCECNSHALVGAYSSLFPTLPLTLSESSVFCRLSTVRPLHPSCFVATFNASSVFMFIVIPTIVVIHCIMLHSTMFFLLFFPYAEKSTAPKKMCHRFSAPA